MNSVVFFVDDTTARNKITMQAYPNYEKILSAISTGIIAINSEGYMVGCYLAVSENTDNIILMSSGR